MNNSKPIKIILLLIAIVVFVTACILLVYLGIYFPKTDEYKTAVNFVVSSEDLREEVGYIEDMRPSFLYYSYTYDDKNPGTIRFCMVVWGSKRRGKVDFELRKHENGWNVNRAILRESSGWEEVELRVPR